MNNKCELHDAEIKEIRKEFNEFKQEFSMKLDDLFDEVRKPIFTDKQIASMIIGVIVYIVVAVTYVNKIDARSIENYNYNKESKVKDEKIMDILITIKEDVATIKGGK